MTQPETPVTHAPPPPPKRGSAVKWLLLLTVLMLAFFGGAVGLLWYAVAGNATGEVTDGTFLHVAIEGGLPDAPPTPGLFDDPSATPPTATELSAAIRRGATDDRIEGLYLDLSGAQAGWATTQEVRAAVSEFVATGKPCVAYASSVMTNGGYYLASACPTVVLSPAAVSLVNGLSVEVTYYKGTLEKLGIEPEYEHVGDYKSAIEVFEREGPSEPASAAYEALLDSLFSQLVRGIAEGRGITVDQATAAIDTPTITPSIALERGYIDALAWPDAMAMHVHQVQQDDWLDLLAQPITDDDEPKLTKVMEYVKDLRAEEDSRGSKIAVIYAEGNIMPGDDEPSLFGDDGQLTDGKYARWMKAVREDDRVKAVVVRVNSPGGSALASSLMWRDNARTKAAGKPIVISMGDYAASGGYLISANADWIVAEPGTLTGSIGVFGGKFDTSGLWAQMGMTSHTYQRGDMATLLSGTHGFDDAQRAVFKDYLQDFYDQFLDIVSEGRNMPREAVHEVAQGRVWTGEQALERGLVDELGALDVAVAKAAELAGLDDDAYDVRRYPRPKTFFEAIMEDLDQAQAPVVQIGLPEVLPPQVRQDLATMVAIDEAGGIAAWLPGVPTVR